MRISIEYVKMPTSEALTAFTERKLHKLNKKYSWLISAKVFFKLEKDANKSKICEIELSLPGPRIFASSREQNFESAVKETISDLTKQLKKRKKVVYNH